MAQVKKVVLVGRLLMLMCVLQAMRWGLESLAFLAVPHTTLTNELVRCAAYAVLFALLVLLARRRGIQMRLMPPAAEYARLGTGYMVGLALLAGLLVATPFMTGQACEPQAWASLVCGSLATPLFEEALFRGYIWERLGLEFGHGWKLVFVTAALFGLWHLGYADAVAWQMAQFDVPAFPPDGLVQVMATKALFGAGMGVVLGALRMKWGNCLAPGILHGIWNVLA